MMDFCITILKQTSLPKRGPNFYKTETTCFSPAPPGVSSFFACPQLIHKE